MVITVRTKVMISAAFSRESALECSESGVPAGLHWCDVLREGLEFQAASNWLLPLFPARVPTGAATNFLPEALERSDNVDLTHRHC